MATYTACYTKIEAGYMGQLLEWPEVITEGATLEECRAKLIEVAEEKIRACLDRGEAPPRIQSPVERFQTVHFEISRAP